MRKSVQIVVRALAFLLAASFAVIFLMPTVLTITNSFMEKSEIAANYGVVFSSLAGSNKTFISDEVNLKFIPDKGACRST